jgi:hypothetical protein
MTRARSLDDLLGGDGEERAADIDAGCAAGFEVLHQYVETTLAGGQAARELPGVAAHLRRCPACQEDYQGLLEAARRFGDADPGPS